MGAIIYELCVSLQELSSSLVSEIYSHEAYKAIMKALLKFQYIWNNSLPKWKEYNN
jgi:hypothetical protein